MFSYSLNHPYKPPHVLLYLQVPRFMAQKYFWAAVRPFGNVRFGL